jgi:hypothetical protein
MTFELLPNEILIECFEYLNAFDIFHSFDQLNNRFNNLIRQIPLSINFEENVNKSIFDEFCTKMLLNPEIKDQVYSLHTHLSVWKSPASLRTGTFFSFFYMKNFPIFKDLKAACRWILYYVVDGRPKCA